MKALSIILLASLCISSSCSKSAANKNSGLYGTWFLKQISGGFAGETKKPDKTTTLTIQSPAVYSKTINSQTTDNGNYIITKATHPNYYYSDSIIKFISARKNDTLTYGMYISNDTLILNEGCCDRFAYTYTRQK